jgi:2-phospho-L-lactate guanylyltransferase
MIAALLPVKSLAAAKGRLSDLLSPDERQRLTLAMMEDVLRAVQAVPDVDLVAAVSPDRDVLDCASAFGAEPIAEPPNCRGINQALTFAAHALVERGAVALLVVAADLPSAAPAEIAAVLAALPDRGIALAPTRDRGTGALALRPPDAVPFRYGHKSSVFHKREAAARGFPARVLHLDSLYRDIDEPKDLAELLQRPAETATQRLLADLHLDERLGALRSA